MRTLEHPPIAREQFSEQFGLQLLTELLASNSPLISRAMGYSHPTLRSTPQLANSYPDMERHPQQTYRSVIPPDSTSSTDHSALLHFR